MFECSWLGGFENRLESPVAGSSGGPDDGEFQVVLSEQVGLGSSDVVLLVEHGGSDDRDGVSRGSVVACHVHVQLADSSVEGNISVLLVHVVVSSSGLISQHYSVGFNMVGSFFVDLVD